MLIMSVKEDVCINFGIWNYSLLFKYIWCKQASKCANKIWVCFQKYFTTLGRYEIKVTWILLCVGMWHVNLWSVQNRPASVLWFWLLMLQCLEFVWQTSGISSHFHHISGYTNTYCYYYKFFVLQIISSLKHNCALTYNLRESIMELFETHHSFILTLVHNVVRNSCSASAQVSKKFKPLNLSIAQPYTTR